MPKVAILDDYAGLALDLADWSPVQTRSEVTVFDRHLSEAEAAEALRPFDVICTMRERMALPRTLIERLPNLKLITIVGLSLPNLDMAAASDCGVLVAHSDFANPRLRSVGDATPELASGLLIATVRTLAEEHRRMRAGGWQSTTGMTPAGARQGESALPLRRPDLPHTHAELEDGAWGLVGEAVLVHRKPNLRRSN